MEEELVRLIEQRILLLNEWLREKDNRIKITYEIMNIDEEINSIRLKQPDTAVRGQPQ